MGARTVHIATMHARPTEIALSDLHAMPGMQYSEQEICHWHSQNIGVEERIQIKTIKQ